MSDSTPAELIQISTRDILFECPACDKSMVIDEAAVGMTVECAGCRQNVIVPARPRPSAQQWWQAVESGNAPLVKALVARGADLEATTDDGHTALMMSAKTGRDDVVQTLIESGADLQKHNREGLSALKLAEQAGHFHIVRMFWKAGVK